MNGIYFLKLIEFEEWYRSQPLKIRIQIDGRLLRIQEFGYFGQIRKLSFILFELKFNNGNRIYCTEKSINGKAIILILGGSKNGQDKDIRKAQKVAEKIHED